MSNRYRFDLENSHDAIRDETGVEVFDLNQAIQQATAGIEEMRANGELIASDDLWEIVIRDEHGSVLKRIAI